MNQKRILPLHDFNPHLMCSLCDGYYIDATTITECLHSFCRACIVRYLETNRFCPVCDVQIHKSKPLLNIRKDVALQSLVYKIVPGLYQNEMRLRQEFADRHPEAAPSKINDASEMCIYSPDEYFSLTLEHWNPMKDIKRNATQNVDDTQERKDATGTEKSIVSSIGYGKRYMRCPAAVTVGHIHKLIRAKHGLDPSHLIELLFKDEVLPDHLTLMDVAYIYEWKRKGPLSLSYRMYANGYKKMKFNDLSTEGGSCCSLPSKPCHVEGENAVKSESKTEPTDKNTDWQEVQLQISETGIMSVSGISLEHNNNLSTPNNNIFDNQTKFKSKSYAEKLEPVGLPKYLTLVDSYCDKKGPKHQELTLPKLRLTPSTVANKQDMVLPGSSCESACNLAGNKPAPLLANRESVDVVDKEKKTCPKGKTSKSNIQNVSEPVVEKNNANVCSALQTADIQNAKRQKLADILKSPNEIIKPASDSQIRKDISKPSDIPFAQVGSKKELLFHQPIVSTSNMPQKYHQNAPGKTTDAKNMHVGSSFAVTPISSQAPKPPKKDLSQGTISYNTRKDSPKNWNPSFTKASYPILITKPSGSNANNNSEKKAEKAPKFFKMRNMPRYLGNPASGVKPMYQLSDNSKTPEAEPSTRTKNVVMKIDPKTLSPIMRGPTSEGLPSASDSQSKSEYKLSHGSCSQKSAIESNSCATSVSSSELDSSKKLTSEKSKLAGGIPVSSSSTLAMNTSPALTNSKSSLTSASALSFKMSHARSIPATTPSSHHHEFCNDAPLQRPHSETSSATASSGIKFNNMPNFSLNPATLNLLSSNLSFLPNASNFLYGNFADFGTPLVRPGLNRSGCLGVIPSSSAGGANSVAAPVCVGSGGSGLPASMGAFHAMPPSINMLFPHHRSTERDRSGSAHAQVHTPAVQRIPASKGTAPTGGHKQNTGKKTLLVGSKGSLGHSINSTKNVRNDEENEAVSTSGTKSDVVGTSPQTQRTDKQATNLNNNSILGADNAKKIEDKPSAVIDDQSSMQKVMTTPNGELDPSICVTSSDTHHGSETVARKELRANEDAGKVEEKHMPLTDLSIMIQTGDKDRNLNEEISDNNNKKVKLSSICLESSSPVMAPDVISKPCTDPR